MVTVILCVFLLSYVYGEGKVSYSPHSFPYHALTFFVRAITLKGVSSYSLILSSSSASIWPATRLTSSSWVSIASTDSLLNLKARHSKPSAGREVGGLSRCWVRLIAFRVHCTQRYSSVASGLGTMGNIVGSYTEHAAANIHRRPRVYICFLNMLE